MWAAVPFDVGHDYGETENAAHIPTESRPTSRRNHWPTWSGITGPHRPEYAGYPAITPPWGTLNAIDLNSGKYLWKIPLGEYPELAVKGMKDTGSENYGGPIVTAGGLVMIGATVYDRKIRAYNSETGKLLWETTLPFAGVATPATYMVDGKQYVVIAAGGGRDPKWPSGGSYVAFALP